MKLPPFRIQRRRSAAAGYALGRAGKETLQFPLPVPGRLAVLNTSFHVAANMKIFAADDIAGLMDYAPDALAAPLGSALFLADHKLRGLLDLPSLKFAIVVFSSVDPKDGGPLAAHQHDLLWKAFGLPVFEQLRGWDGKVVARECEVHNGLHFDAGVRDLVVAGLATGLSAAIEEAHCDCGLETPRLCHLSAARWCAGLAALSFSVPLLYSRGSFNAIFPPPAQRSCRRQGRAPPLRDEHHA